MADADSGWSLPERFDEFTVLRPLGRGGMGHVYLARDVGLDRPVALKFIAGEVGDSSRRRFLTEARALARLTHPNVVGVFRVGELNGRPYIAYEFVPGRNLAQIERPVKWTMALRIGAGLASGLAEVHRAGVLHRDLKPANAVLSDSGTVKLIDFGLARLESSSVGTDPYLKKIDPKQPVHITRQGALMGTPAYLAPEQWRGEPASERSDVYALGLILYELIAGASPHPTEDTTEEIGRIINSRNNPPLRSMRPEVPESLARVIDRCLRREASERYSSAEALGEEIESVKTVFLRHTGAEAPAAIERDAVTIAASFARVAPDLDRFTARLYERLFGKHPELRSLFPAQMDAQRTKLAHALSLTVEGLHEPERLVPALEDLGRRHGFYKVPQEGYGIFQGILLETLREFEQGQWDDSLEQVWTRALGFITATMQRGQGLMKSTLTSGPGSAQSTWRPGAGTAPRTRWADADGVSIAYQEFGEGPVDIALVFGWLTHVEMAWRHPALAGFLRRVGKLGRVLFFDRRGTGLSDRGSRPATLDERVADLRAVMKEVGSKRAVLFGVTQGIATCAAAAAADAERTAGLVLFGGTARMLRAPDHPFGMTREQLDALAERIRGGWGDALFIESNAPSMVNDAGFAAWWAEAMRMSASPGQALAMLRASAEVDLRPILPQVRAPALVLNRSGDKVTSVDEAQDLAGRIPGAKLVVLPGEDHLPYTGETAPLFDAVSSFLAGLT